MQSRSSHRWLSLVLLCSATFMTILDGSIINVALPTIQHELSFTVENLQWIITGYALTYGGFLLFAGRASDLFGRRRLFLTGVTLFSLASLLCGLAPSQLLLIAARLVQGIGGALLTPSALALIVTLFAEGTERNRALGIYGGLSALGAGVGALLGGLLTSTLGWRWVFFVNVPVGVLVVLSSAFTALMASRLGFRSMLIGGVVAMALGLVLLTRIAPGGTYLITLLPGIILFGIGFGILLNTTLIAATAGVSNEEQGLASGLINTTNQIGTAVTIATLTAVSAARTHLLDMTARTSNDHQQALIGGYIFAFLVGLGLLLLALLIILVFIDNKKKQNTPSLVRQTSTPQIEALGKKTHTL